MAHTQQNKVKNLHVKIGIERIALVSKSEVSLPEGKTFEECKDELEYSYDIDSVILPENNTVKITVNYQFTCAEYIIFQMSVENDFKVDKIQEVFDQGQIVNKEFFENLIAISVNHSRGIQSTIISGSIIDGHYMPRINKKNLQLNLNPEPENPADL